MVLGKTWPWGRPDGGLHPCRISPRQGRNCGPPRGRKSHFCGPWTSMAPKFSRARVMVTGGSGFIGSHLCERLLANGDEVLCVDNFYTGRRQNIEHLLSNSRFEVLRHDITHPLYVEVDEI